MNDFMAVNDIAFPNLGIYLDFLPGKTFSIFGFPVAYYGLIIGIGMLLGVLVAGREAKLTGQDPDTYWDFAVFGIIFSIIGARLYYVIFSWDTYKDDLLSIFNTRNGGMAIYGGVIGGFLTLWVFAKLKKKNFFQMVDTGVLGLVVGQIIGRWGNFMNREAFGEYTDGLFAMRLPIEAVRQSYISENITEHIIQGTNYIQVHPTFLYESLWNLMLLAALLLYRRHKKFHGEIGLLYLAGYGIGRFWIEGLRTDQLWIPGTTVAVSQVLAVVLVLASVILLMVGRFWKKKKE